MWGLEPRAHEANVVILLPLLESQFVLSKGMFLFCAYKFHAFIVSSRCMVLSKDSCLGMDG